MISNCEYIKTTAAQLKIANITLTAIVLALAMIGHFDSEYTNNREQFRPIFTGNELRSLWREYLLMGTATICLLASMTNLVLHLVSRNFYWDRRTAIYDFFYHSISGILLGVAGTLFIVSAVKIFEINCTTENKCQHFEVKFSAGALSLVTAIISGTVATVVLTNRKDVERDALIEDK